MDLHCARIADCLVGWLATYVANVDRGCRPGYSYACRFHFIHLLRRSRTPVGAICQTASRVSAPIISRCDILKYFAVMPQGNRLGRRPAVFRAWRATRKGSTGPSTLTYGSGI